MEGEGGSCEGSLDDDDAVSTARSSAAAATGSSEPARRTWWWPWESREEAAAADDDDDDDVSDAAAADTNAASEARAMAREEMRAVEEEEEARADAMRAERERVAALRAEARLARETREASAATDHGSEAASGPTQQESRDTKIAERDAVVKRVLRRDSKTLHAALGLKPRADPAEVRKRARNLLRLLHPDYGINQAQKGTKAYVRIEAAFKKLSGLRDGLDAS